MIPSAHTGAAESPLAQAIRLGLKSAGVPERYLSVAEGQGLPEGRWAYITGSVGAGKTYLAAQMLRSYIALNMGVGHESGRPYDVETGEGVAIYLPPRCRFVSAPTYLDWLKASFVPGDTDSVHRVRSCRTTPLLVIDDLGQEVPTQWAASQLFEIIDYRYSHELQTVITSQFSRDAIGRRLAENGGTEQALAIVSRLAEACDLYELGDTDRRLGAMKGN